MIGIKEECLHDQRVVRITEGALIEVDTRVVDQGPGDEYNITDSIKMVLSLTEAKWLLHDLDIAIRRIQCVGNVEWREADDERGEYGE